LGRGFSSEAPGGDDLSGGHRKRESEWHKTEGKKARDPYINFQGRTRAHIVRSGRFALELGGICRSCLRATLLERKRGLGLLGLLFRSFFGKQGLSLMLCSTAKGKKKKKY